MTIAHLIGNNFQPYTSELQPGFPTLRTTDKENRPWQFAECMQNLSVTKPWQVIYVTFLGC